MPDNLMIGVILGAVSARAATSDPYSLAGVTDKGTFIRYVIGQDQGLITFDWKTRRHVRESFENRMTRDIRIIPDAQGAGKKLRFRRPQRHAGGGETATKSRWTAKRSRQTRRDPLRTAGAARADRPRLRSSEGRSSDGFFAEPAGHPVRSTIEKLEARDSIAAHLFRTSGEDLVLYLDAQGKLLLAHNPNENTGFQREGFGAVRCCRGCIGKTFAKSQGRWDGSIAGRCASSSSSPRNRTAAGREFCGVPIKVPALSSLTKSSWTARN